MNKLYFLPILILSLVACGPPTSDQIQTAQQERILQEGTASVGMPDIANFRERRILKTILELRDQDGLVTYTYTEAMDGTLVFFGETIGYAIPYAAQFTSPQKIEYQNGGHYVQMPQADPNGLFSPASAEGSWILMADPAGGEARPVYVEPRIVVSPFRLPNAKYPAGK